MLKTNLIIELKKLYSNQELFNSIIITSKSHEDSLATANELIRYMFCINKNLISDDCINCHRAMGQNLFDVMFIGDGANAIAKEDIQVMISKMSLSAIEATQIKVYVIDNAENLKTSASNSLLKFLEEPPLNTYAILLSKDRSDILPTIKSRCKIFVIESEKNNSELNLFEKILMTNNKDTYLLATEKFKKMEKKDLINNLEEAYSRTIIKKYLKFAEQTLILINDLKYGINDKLAIDYYFIKITEEM